MQPSQQLLKQPSKPKLFVRFPLLLALLWLGAGCSSSKDVLPTDAAMIAQWQSETDSLQDLAETCESTVETYNLAERYTTEHGLIATTALEPFEGCDVESGLVHLAKNDDISLFVVSQYRKGTGWIEETASNVTGGWVSWKSAILEEKGFLYIPQSIPQSETVLSNAVFPRLSVVDEPLDQFVGKYRGTSQISGNSSCELWRLRLIEPGWYLFYHQSRECPT